MQKKLVSKNTLYVMEKEKLQEKPGLSVWEIKLTKSHLLENVYERTVSHYFCKVLKLPSHHAGKKNNIFDNHAQKIVFMQRKVWYSPFGKGVYNSVVSEQHSQLMACIVDMFQGLCALGHQENFWAPGEN